MARVEVRGRRTVRTMCPMNCHPTFCGMLIDVEDGRVVGVRGDRDNPDSRGFLCVRGAAAGEIDGEAVTLVTPAPRTREMSPSPHGRVARSRPIMRVNGLTGSLDSMRLSRESEYGLEGLKVLARQPAGEVMLLQNIATAGELPERFLAKIFQKLSRHGVALSHRGAVRGYSLARPAGAITLREILEAIEGQGLFDRCVFRPARCSPRRPCSLHDRWATLKPQLERMLETTTLEELAAIPSRSARQRWGL